MWRRLPRTQALTWVFALWLALPSFAEAQSRGLRIERVEANGIRVDGMLREWRGVEMANLGGEDRDASMDFALAYDAEGLYVGALVRDQRLVRTARPGREEDALVLTLALPGRRGNAVEVWLFAGRPGRSGAVGALATVGGRPRADPRVRVVEGPSQRGTGYSLEAFIPFAALPNGARWRDGRGALALRDYDQEAHPTLEATLATAEIDRTHLERLPRLVPTGGAEDALRSFLAERGMAGIEPRYAFTKDVCGDATAERVAVVGRFVVVYGEAYKGGRGYDFLALAVRGASGVRDASIRDLTGDGRDELVVEVREENAAGAREVWRVFGFDCRGVRPLFAIETKKELPQGEVSASVRVRPARRGAPIIETRAGTARGLDAESLQERPASDAESILLPWGPARARRYQFDGQRFATVHEERNPAYRAPSATGAATGRATRATVPPAQEPVARTPEELLAAIRQDRGIPRSIQPRFRARKNVAAGPDPEHVMVLGRALVVFGPAYRHGQTYFYYQLPVEQDDDVLGLEIADLTGNGREELLLTVRQRVGDVTRELLLVHCMARSGFPRILAVEVARSQGSSEVRNVVTLVGRGPKQIQLRPGRARGWDASSWPWGPEEGGDIRPVLLPWRDQPVRYGFRDGALRAL